MQAQRIVSAYDVSRPDSRSSQDTVLLIGGENAFKSDIANRMLCGFQFRIAGQATTLLEGLSHLQSNAIDVVLLSSEFREEELSLFAFDARRRGFSGLILHIASMPQPVRSTPLPDRLGRRSSEAEFRHQLLHSSSMQPDVHPPAPDLQRRLETREADGSTSLTPRQQAVLARVSDGWTNHQIAQCLKCSEGSVKAILQQLFKKLGVRKRVQIVRMAFETTLIRIKEDQSSDTDDSPPDRLVQRDQNETGPATPVSPALGESKRIKVGDFVIDLSSCRAWVRGVEAHLTTREFELLTIFCRHPQELLSRDGLARALPCRRPLSRSSLTVAVQCLRRKVDTTPQPQYILTQRRDGYRFIPSP